MNRPVATARQCNKVVTRPVSTAGQGNKVVIRPVSTAGQGNKVVTRPVSITGHWNKAMTIKTGFSIQGCYKTGFSTHQTSLLQDWLLHTSV